MKTKIKEEDYYECKSCKINSLSKRWCPCPRGGCDALIVGTIRTTKELITTLTQEQIDWNLNK